MSRPRILQLAWPQQEEPPQTIVVTFCTSKKRRRFREEDDEFKTYSDRLPVKYIKCSSLEEAQEICFLAAARSTDILEEAGNIEEEGFACSLDQRLAESHRRDLFDEVVRSLRPLTVTGVRTLQKAGDVFEILEVDTALATPTVPAPVFQSPLANDRTSGKRKRRSASPSSSRFEEAVLGDGERSVSVFYAIDVGFQKVVETEADTTLSGVSQTVLPPSSIKQRTARNLIIQEFEQLPATLGAFLDVPIATHEPMPELLHRGVREPFCEGIAVDEAQDEYFDDFKDLYREGDNCSIDYLSNSSGSVNDQLSDVSEDQLSYDAISD